MSEVRQSRTLRAVSVATLASQILIVLTGGLVRLTESGLGCTDWPHCTPDSFFPVPEHGIHGFIEYANRLLGAVVIGISIWMLVLAIRKAKSAGGREILTLAALVFFLSAAQGIIGAVVVWLELRPDTVGIHFMLSVVLVALSTMLVWRVFRGPRGPKVATAPQFVLTHGATALFAIVIVMGTLTTGAGPHAGDGGAVRNGLNPELLQHFHAWPSYALLLVTLALLVVAVRKGPRIHLFSVLGLLAASLFQMVIGLIQANTGLPVPLVAAHMMGSVFAAAAMTATVLSLRGKAEVSA